MQQVIACPRHVCSLYDVRLNDSCNYLCYSCLYNLVRYFEQDLFSRNLVSPGGRLSDLCLHELWWTVGNRFHSVVETACESDKVCIGCH
jgi:hypothetical protein